MSPYRPGDPVSLNTERFDIRSLEIRDVGELYLSWLHNHEITRFLQVDHNPPGIDELREYVESHDNRTSFLLGIFTKDGLHIGNHRARYWPQHGLVSLSIMIGDRAFWGQHVVLECRARVLDFLFDKIGAFKIQGGCTSDNYPAVFNYRKQNWTQDGINRSHYVNDGERVDLIYYAMYRDEWWSLREGNS